MMEYWDPLRKKNVAATPEEKVRQWFIAHLTEELLVPRHMMMSEVSMKLGGKPFRADIVIYGRGGEPLTVVECKREDVVISMDVAQQALRYNMVLGVKFIILTNGRQTFCFSREGELFVRMDRLPKYEEMICRQ